MNIGEKKSKKGDKIFFYFDLGRGPGQRQSTGIFKYVKPKTDLQKIHNKQALSLLEVKRGEMILEKQAIAK